MQFHLALSRKLMLNTVINITARPVCSITESITLYISDTLFVYFFLSSLAFTAWSLISPGSLRKAFI